MTTSLQQLQQQLSQCQLRDRSRIQRQLQQAQRRQRADKPIDRILQRLQTEIERSSQCSLQRQQQTPAIHFPPALPISQRRDELAELIAANQVVIVAGETGSGKTTQLPKICLQLGRGVFGMIGHTQPRRLAARSVARRLAEELQVELGGSVGYQVRFTDQLSASSQIKLMTDGILLAEIQQDPDLLNYDTLIIDEAHERSLNIDFLLGYLKQLLPRRPDLKLIITSATIDLEKFSRHFDQAPIIQVSGRSYPVEIRYRPVAENSDDGDLGEAVAAAAEELMQQDRAGQGDILVFLSGEADIRRLSKQLRQRNWRDCSVLPLYARLSNAEQDKVFNLQQRRGRRIVLATNVAETSLTVPGIRYVIDTGLARISRYSFRSKMQRLPIEPISQASANQRSGRCGRTAEGICIRLYDEEDFLNRPLFTEPEIQRTHLASVILQMLRLGIDDVEAFPFVDPPDRRLWNDGFKLLEELSAVAGRQKLTAVGRQLAEFPLDPRLSRMLVAAEASGCLREMLVISSALSIQDPRDVPADKQAQARQSHARFQDPRSDFVAYLNLWNYVEEQRQEHSQNQWRRQCLREYLSFVRLREWREIHRQLRLVCQQLGWRENQQAADYNTVHRAILSGYLSQIAQRDEGRNYLATRNRKLVLFPGSSLTKKPPKWLVAAEITETSQVFARCCAEIEPLWTLGINDALFKEHFYEPHWQPRSGRVMAYRSLNLYGLTVSEREKVHYGPVDPVLSRELLIRGALVEGRYKTHAAYFQHNKQLVDEVEQLEEKSRRRDILVDDEQLFRFFDQRLPDNIITARHFERWRKLQEQEQPQLLFLQRQDLMQHQAAAVTEAQFPDQLHWQGIDYRLDYRFEPGHAVDGLSVTVPIALLNRLPRYRFEWLVPGMLAEKCVALLKTLVKQQRKKLVPIPETVAAFLAEQSPCDRPLPEVLAEWLYRQRRIELSADDWQLQQLDNYYRVNYRIVDAEGALLGQSRDLADLLQHYAGDVSESLNQQSNLHFEKTAIQHWDFGDLPDSVSFEQAGLTITSYPALVDCRDSVAIELRDYPEQAVQESEAGMVRLLMLQLPQQVKQLKKQLLQGNRLQLQFAATEQSRQQWLDASLYLIFYRSFLQDQLLPRDQQAFEACLRQGKGVLFEHAEAINDLLLEILDTFSSIRKTLRKTSQLAWVNNIADVNRQLTLLFSQDFITDTPWDWLQQYPRYLQAIQQRVEKLSGNFPRDRQMTLMLGPWMDKLDSRWHSNLQARQQCEPLLNYRWLLEEFRVSLFAQGLGTVLPASEKRLQKLWQEVQQHQQVSA